MKIYIANMTELGKKRHMTRLSVRQTRRQELYKTHLSKNISEGPSNKGCHGLGKQRLVIKGLVVGGPSGDSTSTDESGVTEQRAANGLVLVEGRRLDDAGLFGESWIRADTKGAHGEREGEEKGGGELHCFQKLGWCQVQICKMLWSVKERCRWIPRGLAFECHHPKHIIASRNVSWNSTSEVGTFGSSGLSKLWKQR